MMAQVWAETFNLYICIYSDILNMKIILIALVFNFLVVYYLLSNVAKKVGIRGCISW